MGGAGLWQVEQRGGEEEVAGAGTGMKSSRMRGVPRSWGEMADVVVMVSVDVAVVTVVVV